MLIEINFTIQLIESRKREIIYIKMQTANSVEQKKIEHMNVHCEHNFVINFKSEIIINN